MNSKGYMRISREIEKWGWYRDANTFRVFFHLLLKAQYQEGEYMGEKILRGQVATGRKQLAADLCISEQGIRTAINHLVKSGEINQRATNKFSIITICNFDSWQCLSESTNQQTNQQSTSNQPATSIEINHIQRIKELEERNNKLKEELADASKKKKSELDLSDVRPDMMDVVTEWLAYKKERKEPYKQRGFTMFYKRLLELSSGDSDKARKIIEQSMASNYQGIFPLNQSSLFAGMLPGQILESNREEKIKNAETW